MVIIVVIIVVVIIFIIMYTTCIDYGLLPSPSLQITFSYCMLSLHFQLTLIMFLHYAKVKLKPS